MAEKKNTIWETGRRKSAVARVRMIAGSGTINLAPGNAWSISSKTRPRAT